MTNSSAITPIPLNTMMFPLHGARLIEASAGTGKTFTIAGLYLRLLLGHGDPQTRHQVPLTVDQILVVTFTEAATAELRDRIRARIHDARLAFSRGVSHDPVIKPLLDEVEDHASAAEILLQAERQMDEAAVFTIHGFCQRMLTQNAFESGSRFENEFVTDESRLKSQVVADYWRKNFYDLPFELAAEVRNLWASPESLLVEISRYLTGSELTLSVAPMEGALADLHQENLERIRTLKALWLTECDGFEKLISESGVNKRSYTKKSLPTWLESVKAWATSETLDYQIPDKLEKFSQKTLLEKTAKEPAPVHAVFSAVEAFLDHPVSLKPALLAHAIKHCRSMLAEVKSQKQWLSFDDLLTQLSAALDTDSEALLADRIRGLFPVAMIDEFQDTDPLQYSIFSRIYLDHPDAGLFMIGDPKQAIYAFRGADIFTYIKARNQVTAHYTLGTNWRSSADMVAAVNQVFEQADSPFIYDQDIPFLPVAHSPGAESRAWYLHGLKQPALTYWSPDDIEKPITKGDYQTQMSEGAANHIQRVLLAAQNHQATLGKEAQHTIQAGDIAVLVRTGAEGRLMQSALAERGIASVYLSNKDSVFSSVIAKDIQRLLQAVLTPENDRALRACLGSHLFALTAMELDLLNRDENAWDDAVNEFKQYRVTWSQRGVLPMLRGVISKRNIAERMLEEESGERDLTDLMHIGELLQQATQEIDSDHGLLRWLAQSISDTEQGLGGQEEQVQRLESERNLVQIVTIHKSKGLEYDLVYLPFVLSYREASEAKYYDAENDTTVLDIAENPTHLAQADKERLAEDLRLIYVALTRAVYGCFIGIAPLRNGRSTKEPTGVHKSAMGYLLQNGQEGSIDDLNQALNRHQNDEGSVVVTAVPEDNDHAYVVHDAPAEELTAATLSREIERGWRITSYSGLVKQGSHHNHDATMEIGGFDLDSADEASDAQQEEPERSIFNFPKGARPGTFLHTLFEELEFTLSPYDESQTAIIMQLLEAEAYDPEWLPILQQLVERVLSTPLDNKALCLNQIQPKQRLVEMEFLLPIELLTAPALNRIVQRHDLLSAKAGDLGFYNAQGMLKGFIDLVFEHQGKYYVLDWKSNYLGDQVADYHGAALQQAMADHRYDLQYQIYALALHRFLRSRLPHYDYEQHFGGVYYLFLRGVDGDAEHGVFHAKPSIALLSELDSLIDGQEIQYQDIEENGQMGLGL